MVCVHLSNVAFSGLIPGAFVLNALLVWQLSIISVTIFLNHLLVNENTDCSLTGYARFPVVYSLVIARNPVVRRERHVLVPLAGAIANSRSRAVGQNLELRN